MELENFDELINIWVVEGLNEAHVIRSGKLILKCCKYQSMQPVNIFDTQCTVRNENHLTVAT